MKVCVECKSDTALVQALGFEAVHERNKSKVTKFVVRKEGIPGLEDEDPWAKPSKLLSRFQEKERRNDVALLEWKDKRIILLCPRLEEWILRAAKEEGIDVRKKPYNLPDEPERLHEVISNKRTEIKQLVKAIRKNKRVQQLLSYLNS